MEIIDSKSAVRVNNFVVDLHEHTCSCIKGRGGGECPNYVHSKYFKATLLKSYENLINPLNGPPPIKKSHEEEGTIYKYIYIIPF